MRFPSLVVAVFIAIGTTVAQDIPACLAECSASEARSLLYVTSASRRLCSAAPPDGCPTDPNGAQKCACEDKQFLDAAFVCMAKTCNTEEEFDEAELIAVAVCAQQGVAIAPTQTFIGPQPTGTGY